jgi:hypothetical protein
MSNEQKPSVIPAQIAQPGIQGVHNKQVEITQTPEFQAAVQAAVDAALKNAAVPATAPVASTPALEKYLEVVMAREARESLEQQEKFRVIAVRAANRDKNSAHNEHEVREKQRRCRHVKGGKLQKAGVHDPNLAKHTFTDGTVRIRCQSCGMIWKMKDTKEFLYRGKTINGQTVIQKYRNHVGIGFHEAWQMLQDSSNTETKSEVVMNVNPAAQVAAAGDTAAHERKATEEELYGKPVLD